VQDLQGTEMDVVIISCVRTEIQDRDRNLAILTDHWNVAVTRAIESLFICGHLKTLQANEVLKDLIFDADKRQVIHRVSSKFERSMLYDILLKPADYTQL
jgi:superfamily I DNA and/or RNA helicase